MPSGVASLLSDTQWFLVGRAHVFWRLSILGMMVSQSLCLRLWVKLLLLARDHHDLSL